MRTYKFEELFEFIRNGLNIKQDKSSGGIPITRIETIAESFIDPRRCGYAGLTREASEEWLLVSGDILFSHINSLDHIGKCAVYNGVPENIIHGMNLLCLRPKKELLYSGFAKYLIRSDSFKKAISPFVNKSVNQASISVGNLKGVVVHIPSLLEQKRIAAILDKADALRAKCRKALEQLDALAQAIFIEMFGAPSEPVRWPVIRVDESGSVQLGRQRAPKYQTGNYTTPYLRVANVFEDRIDLSDLLSMDFDSRDRATYSLEYGDILLNEGQSTELVGRPAMWRNELPGTCFQNTLVRYRANPTKTNPEYALALFLSYYRTGELSRISSKTSNVAHLGASRFSAMPFPLPPLELQKEFSLRLCSVRRLKQRAASQLQKMDALFSSLQHRAFRGEL